MWYHDYMRRFLQSVFLFSGDTDQVPALLRRSAMVGMMAMVLVSFMAANLQALLWQSSQWLVSTILPAIVVELTNEERSENAAQPLRRSAVLDEAATRKAEHMAAQGYFAHYSPEGVSPWHWFDTVDYSYAHAGENLAIHFSDSGEVVEAWMDSPTHRANIVNNNFTEIGVGTAKGTYEGYETVFVVQLFGTPALPVATPVPQIQAPSTPGAYIPTELSAAEAGGESVLAEATSSPVATEEAALMVVDLAIAPETTLVTESASATELAMSYETTPTVPGAPATPLQPDLEVAEVAVTDAGVSMYSGLMATSSGLPVLLTTPADDTAGATETAFISRIATQPNTLLTIVYAALASTIGVMLLLAVALAWRAHRPRQMAYALGLLLLMSGLMTIHYYVTAGAVVV